jgi:hypothetical protein
MREEEGGGRERESMFAYEYAGVYSTAYLKKHFSINSRVQ